VSTLYALRTENPAYTRRIVRAALPGATTEVVETAQLLTSELVTNAIRHGSGDPILLLDIRTHCLHAEVRDSDTTQDLETLQVEPSMDRGRGLAILDALAPSWGVERRRDGKAIWFDFNL
jgi:anti-sigma regulatory factor (Ser/Thr protein kinase)